MHEYIQLITINEKGGHEFEREWGEVDESLWRKDEEGRSVAIKL